MSIAARKETNDPGTREAVSDRPLSALLSQVLVAFTVEFDNEFERQMIESGYPGARLSLVVWSNLLRFLAKDGSTVGELAEKALAPQERIKFELGCLERWGFVALQPDPANGQPIRIRAHGRTGQDRRDGWGSGRGIRTDWVVNLTSKARKAREIWPPLFGMIEHRWRARFGDEKIRRLVDSLQTCVSQLDVELPHGLPEPVRIAGGPAGLPLAALLSQLLLAFRIEFDRESNVSLTLSANVLRVLAGKPARLGDLSHLTGASPETCGIGWRLKHYVTVEPDANASRGKVVCLTPIGRKAVETYHRLVGDIERGWEARFGRGAIHKLRESLRGLFSQRAGDRPLLSEGLVPPAGVARAGCQTPALGRQDVGAAARQRMRDLVTQTEAFVRDPAGALPHYPLWDMNRGFGP